MSVGPPGAIQILLHHHAVWGPYPTPSPFYDETIERFLKLGILVPSDDESKYGTTDKGKHLVEMLCSTPIPEQRFVDPRFSQPSDT